MEIQPFTYYTVPGLNPTHTVLVQALSPHHTPSGDYWRVRPVLAYQVLLPRAYYRPSEMVPAKR